MSTIFKLRFVLLFMCSVAMGNFSLAQTYCHTETNTPFSFLPTPTVLTGDSIWDDNKYLLPIGFDFLFQGNLYDKLTVETNGRVYFSDVLGENDDPTITIFGGKASEVDMIDRGYLSGTALSPIGYQLFENPTDTFLIIEYKNIGFFKDQPGQTDSISFQLKLFREAGKIEIHIGPHKIIDTSSFYNIWPSIGMGNPSEDNGYFLTGDPSNPGESNSIQPLDTLPDNGMRYTFTPLFPTPTVTIASNPADGCFDPLTNYLFTATIDNAGAPFFNWKKNGTIISGEDSDIYNAGTLALDDTITCMITLRTVCPTALPITSNRIIVSRPVASVSIVSDDTTICNGETILFTASVINEGENPVFKWIRNTDTLTTTSNEFMASGLTDQDEIKCLLVSDERCVVNPEVVSSSIVVTVLPIITPTISIIASKDSICTGDSILYTATITSGGGSPTYRWKRNGTEFGGNTSSIYATDLNDLDTIRCELVSSLPCITGEVVSNYHVAKVRTYITASVSINADLIDFCSGQTVTFTASPVNGGATPTYTWKNNGSTTGTNNASLISSTFSDEDSIVCIMSSSLFCSNADTSNFIKLIVHPVIIPSVSIVMNKDSICTGQSLLFTATAVNAGTPSYQWKVNGNDAGTNSNLFASSSLNNNDVVNCVITPNLNCLSAATATSNNLIAKVVPYVTASVSITSNASTVCTITPVTFTANPSNQGTIPVYQWYKNGVPVGTNNSTYTASGFTNTDQVVCTLTSSLYCVNSSPATSNSIVLTVLTGPTSSISIVSSQNPICAGGNITFQATPIGIANPVYQWQLNSSNVGINSSSFTASGFSNNDEVLCKITNSVDCSGGLPTSNIVQILVNSSADPLITIEPDKNTLCQEDTVVYTAITTGTGTSPVYEWKLNGTVVGSNTSTYTQIHPSNNDLVICSVTTAANCKTISNTLSATVNICLGTEEISHQSSFAISPNPFSDYLSIELTVQSETTLTLMEATGKEIRKESISANTTFKTDWSLITLPPGMYILKATGDKETLLRKILKQ